MQLKPMTKVKQNLLAALFAAVVMGAGGATGSVVSAAPLSLGSTTLQIPAGTLLPVVMMTPLDARTSAVGDAVTARLNQDLFYRTREQEPLQVVLPKGTTLRGRVTHVKQPRWFSKGGWLGWTFDQVVLPNGQLQAIQLEISANNDDARTLPPVSMPATASASGNGAQQPSVTPSPVPTSTGQALYQDPGVAPKLRDSVSDGVTSFQALSQAGIQAGERLGGTPGKVIAAPIAVIGGAAVGAGTMAREGVKSLVLPGESVVIDPGYQLLVDFGGAFDIPGQ